MHFDFVGWIALDTLYFEGFVVRVTLRTFLVAIVHLKEAIPSGWTYKSLSQAWESAKSTKVDTEEALLDMFLP